MDVYARVAVKMTLLALVFYALNAFKSAQVITRKEPHFTVRIRAKGELKQGLC